MDQDVGNGYDGCRGNTIRWRCGGRGWLCASKGNHSSEQLGGGFWRILDPEMGRNAGSHEGGSHRKKWREVADPDARLMQSGVSKVDEF